MIRRCGRVDLADGVDRERWRVEVSGAGFKLMGHER